MFTNNTSSSHKNDVPLSYSSTQSKGFIQSRFHKLNGELAPMGLASPITVADNEYDKFQSEPRFGGTDHNDTTTHQHLQSSNKKSVKFMDE